jgi:hypothetical protein
VPIVPAILAVANSHVHFISQFGDLRIRRVVGRLKAAATLSIKEGDFKDSSIWATGCHMESLYREDDFIAAFQYVERHSAEGAVIYKWQSNIQWTFDR